GFSMEDIFERFGGMCGGQFGGFGGGGSSRRVNRGSDLRIKVKLSLKDIANGVDKKLKINKLVTCDKCGGSGAKDSHSFTTCNTCNGSGHVTQVVNTFFGRTQTTAQCPTCHGEGKIITAKCDKCAGNGVVRDEEVVEVHIPKGIGEGMQLSVSGKGNAAKNGGVNGDLLIVIEEEQHPELTRDINDLIYNLKLKVTDAILGTSIEVPSVDGKVKIKIEAGTQPGRVLRLRGKGLPDINGYRTGDLLVCVDIHIPTSITKDERKILETLNNSPSFKVNDKNKSEANIFDRMRNFFR
ncbi:MAG: DnaJ C-terminal domain-containing protein, partial [Rikenellaceae bacterium]